MQSLHFNSGSIKLTRERATIISCWEAAEVARWIKGLAGIEPNISDTFFQHNIDGIALTLLLREDLVRMGITKLDQQLILIQSIDLLRTLVSRLSSETLALLFMRIHCAATTCFNILKRSDGEHLNSNTTLNSPDLYAAISNLSDVIVLTCNWLGRLPFIENNEYIEVRGKIIKFLAQMYTLIRKMRMGDQLNMAKSKLIVEIDNIRTLAISLVRQNKDSLFSSDCYLTRVHLRKPPKNDMNIEYTTMPDYTHIISSIETEAVKSIGSGFSAINIGDEIIEINNQVVIGWDPMHFDRLIHLSSHLNEICLLVKKMPGHNDDEIYTKRLADGPQNHRRHRPGGSLEQRKVKAQENRTMLLEQDGKIEIESDDEALYQSKRTSQIKRDQHLSLPDLMETIPNNDNNVESNQMSLAQIKIDSKQSDIQTRPQSAGGNLSSPNFTPKSTRKMNLDSHILPWFRSKQDSKSVIADMTDHGNKDHPQLVNVRRIHSTCVKDSSNRSLTSLQDEQITATTLNKSESQASLQTGSSRQSSMSNIFKSFDLSEKCRMRRLIDERKRSATLHHESKSETSSMYSSISNVVTNKPPLNNSDRRKNSIERIRIRRSSSYRNISCKDLGKGDCEGILYRHTPKITNPFVQWRRYWCVLQGGTLFIFKSKDDANQENEITLEGKNVSPAPDKKKFGFRIADETGQNLEYFSCRTRDEMAKWMNKLGLAAINFNIDDSKIGGFNKGFVSSREGSPATKSCTSSISKHHRSKPSSQGESENESDKESILSSQKSISYHSSISDIELPKDKNSIDNDNKKHMFIKQYTSSSSSLVSLTEPANNSLKSKLNHFSRQTILPPTRKGHHRTCSSPIRFLPVYDDDRKNIYVNTAPKCSNTDLINEQSCQRTFVNSKLLHDNVNKPGQIEINYESIMLQSSGGFATPITSSSVHSNEQNIFYFPLSSQTQSENSVFIIEDDDSSSLSLHSLGSCFDKGVSFVEDPLSPAFQTEHGTSPINTHQSCSPTVLRTSPLHISVCSTTPPIPMVRSTNSTSSPTVRDNQSPLTHQSPALLTSKLTDKFEVTPSPSSSIVDK